MILYHGTNVDFNKIDISKCLPYKDFGCGFYLTDIQKQAAKEEFDAFMAERF